MSSSTTLEPPVSCKQQYGCKEPLYRNTQCCVLHLPDADKLADFEIELNKRLSDQNFDFRGFWFPKAYFRDRSFASEVNFNGATFNGEADFLFTKFEQPVSFRKATFNRVFFGARFIGKADFSQTIFNRSADFTKVNFEKESDFFAASFKSRARFEDASFSGATTFEKASFGGTTNFRSKIFGGAVNFSSVNFAGDVVFEVEKFVGEATFYNTIFEKRADFKTTFKRKAHFSETEFRGRAKFADVIFEQEANFFSARFSFISTFDAAHFTLLTNFDEASFKERVSFKSAIFDKPVSFRGASFEDRVLFDSVTFKGEASFYLANFKDYVRFKDNQVFSTQSPPNFREAKFNNPRLVSFHSVTLRPSWFVEVDASEFTFTNVTWNWGNAKRNWARVTIDNEIDEITNHHTGLSSRHEAHPLLSIACRQLAVNAEENHRYEEASKFRYLAMESRRLAIVRKADSTLNCGEGTNTLTRLGGRFRRYWSSHFTLPGAYRFLSGYGEDITRALLVLIGIWLVFGVLYVTVLRDETEPIGLLRGFIYSAAVLTLQRPEPHPTTAITQALVAMEVILGPVQAALLALAIRRKFMR